VEHKGDVLLLVVVVTITAILSIHETFIVGVFGS